ncbi:MAG: aminoglycoside phosphotransferase family protein [Aeromonas sp.]
MSDRTTLLTHWARSVSGDAALALDLVSGDASFRRYFRGAGKIWVDADPKTEKNHEFIRNAAALKTVGLHVPEVFAADETLGFLALSDLGDTQLFSVLNAKNVTDWYEKAIDQLPAFDQIVRLPLEIFDAEFMARENAIFPEWLLGTHLGWVLSDAERVLLEDTFACLTENNLVQPQGVMHRDFHSRNLMVCAPAGAPAPFELADCRIGVIDFQDMVYGPMTYDLVSLLKDCYVRWPDEVIEYGMRYGFGVLRETGQLGALDYAGFRRYADLTGVQRHLKAAGIFARLHHRDGKSNYLADIPRTLDYVVDACHYHAPNYPVLGHFSRWIERVVQPAFQGLSFERVDP